jgi:ABC-type dipeptide/oligopeptide/nickel transport system permease subunit
VAGSTEPREVTVLAINIVGDGLRDAFDPRLKT